MKMQEIRDLARERGVKPGKLNKVKLVKQLQLNEGNFDCFATNHTGDCDQVRCLWRADCLTLGKQQSS